MKAKFAGLIVIVALVVGVFALSNAPPTNEFGQEYVTDPDTGDQLNPAELDLPDDPIISLDVPAFDAKTTSADCEGTTDAFFKAQCYSNLAAIKNDFSFCNSISEPDISNLCFYDIAVQQKNPDLCFKASFGTVDCLTEIALASNQPAVCEKASFEKSTCLKALRENNLEICRALGNNMGNCAQAVASKDASYCEAISNGADNCFFELGIATNNSDLCRKITLPTLSDSCYFEVALNTNNHNLCELLKDSRDNCVAFIALNTNDKKLCDLAGKEKESCLNDLEEN